LGAKGSGRWYRQDKKMTTSSLPRLQIKTLKESGCLEPGFAGILRLAENRSSSLLIPFRSEKDRILLNDPEGRHNGQAALVIPLDRLPCHYGGFRTWFRCPRCNRRTTSLYGFSTLLACRECQNLTYESQQKNKIDRLIDRVHRIFEQLGSPETGALSAIPKRPFRMGRKSYSKLRIEAEDTQDLLREAIIQRFGFPS
jgi:hypothetical protein